MCPKSYTTPIWLWLSLTFCWLQPATPAKGDEPSANAEPTAVASSLGEEAQRGYGLFLHNCAHCHGDDALGDEGPGLRDLKKSDARIAKIIKEGIKGEMPRFGAKLNDADVRALIAYLRTLGN